MKTIEDYKISELKKLPVRHWSQIKSYQSICVIPSGFKHDSGFALMAIIGINEALEIAASCDDICWDMSLVGEYDFRTDMYYKPNIIHFWSNKFIFEVGASLSSTNIKLLPK